MQAQAVPGTRKMCRGHCFRRRCAVSSVFATGVLPPPHWSSSVRQILGGLYQTKNDSDVHISLRRTNLGCISPSSALHRLPKTRPPLPRAGSHHSRLHPSPHQPMRDRDFRLLPRPSVPVCSAKRVGKPAIDVEEYIDRVRSTHRVIIVDVPASYESRRCSTGSVESSRGRRGSWSIVRMEMC